MEGIVTKWSRMVQPPHVGWFTICETLTGVAVLRQQWSGREVVNHPEAERLNGQIRRVYDGLHEKMSTIAPPFPQLFIVYS